ncbi:MAG: RHS repeat-associated core domain-containing protein, partial [Trebonia sp.]
LTSGSTAVASVSYGYNAGGTLTSKATSGFAGSSASTYGYDQAGRLTSWDNGTATTGYAYDGAGNRVRAGGTTYSYDARDQLTSDGTSSYSYTADGDLASVTGPSGTVTSTSDAYGQQGAQGTQASTYDALGRDVRLTVAGGAVTTLSYEGTGGQLASDGAYDYTWTPGGTLTGTAGAGSPGAGVLDFTDRHTDLAGQFTPGGAALAGSRSFGPWGAVTAAGGSVAGSLGYQSQYASPATGQVDMGARWYNPATGSFGNRDTVSSKPVPDSASASPFGYAADSPLDLADPTGHYVTAYSGPLTTAQQRQEAAQQEASISAAAASGARQAAAAAKAAPLDAHQLHLAYLARLAALGLAPAKAAPVKKPAAAAPRPYDGPVTCAEGALTQCMSQAYAAGGGQFDANGIPNGKGYVAPVLSAAQVKQQNDATRQAQKQAIDNLEYDLRKPATPASAKPAGRVVPSDPATCARFGEGCTGGTAPAGGSGARAALSQAFGLFNEGANWLDANLGIDSAVGCATGPSLGGCEQAAGAVAIGALSVLTDGGAEAVDAALQALEEEGSGLIDAAESCLTGGKSFSADTRVLLASGAAVPISQLRIGDKVLATSTKTGKTQAELVAAVLLHHDTDLYNLTVKTSHGNQVIHTTASHLFWDPYPHYGRIPAKQLKPGMRLKTPDGQAAVVVGGSVPAVHDGWMWDLTVPGNNDHDFYVLPARTGNSSADHVPGGGVPVLVHNCGTGTITDEVMNDDVLPRHSLELDHQYPEFSDKSKFAEGVTPAQIRQRAKDAMQTPIDSMNLGTGSAHSHLFDVGEEIGFDGETHVRVWVENGNVTSIYPEVP